METRDHLPTEQSNSRSQDLDRLSVADAFDVINTEDAEVAHAVALAKDSIVRAIELIVRRLELRGRLFYVGAGTSGRLGVLDAAECPPTFQSDPQMVQGVIAGGTAAVTSSIEGAEDSREAARAALFERNLSHQDVVFGIAAGGTTPFVHGAIAAARERGAATIFFACVPREQAHDDADVSIRVITGPEVIAGSTRMKAGTATKMVLNMVSTLAMVRLGKTYGNLMIDVDTRGNAKLWQRGIGLVAQATGVDRARAEEWLDRAHGQVKLAVAAGKLGVDVERARQLLEEADGSLRRVLNE